MSATDDAVTTFILARPVPGPRIVPFGQTRLATDVLANGRPAFRVTQRFATIDAYWRSTHPNATSRELEDAPRHNATDLGNWWCGDQAYAVWGGKVQTIGPDQYGALGIIIEHGAFLSVYWHLNAFSVPNGATVAKGQQIGIVGKTGLGAVCHLHFEIKVSGTRIDPEPYLLGAPLVIEDDDVNLLPGLEHLVQATIPLGTNLRRLPTTTSEARKLTAEARVALFGVIRGQGEYTIGGKVGTDWAMLGAFNEVWYVAAPLVARPVLTASGATAIPLPIADCSAQDATIAQLNNKLARASTSAAGAAQAATATVEALR